MSSAITAAVVVAGGAAYAANKASQASKDASKAQTQAAESGIAAEIQMQERALEVMAPYRNAGYSALTGLQGLTDPAQRAQMLGDYYNSNEYSQMANQAEASTLRSQSAQGGLRGGSTYSQLESIAPSLGQSYLTNQYNQLTGLANMGMGASSQGASSYSNLGSSMSNAYNNIGASQASALIASQNAQNQAFNTGLSALTNAGVSYFGGTV
jgi:hypothetical protein